MISLAVLCVFLVLILAALQPIDGLSSQLQTRLIVGLIIGVSVIGLLTFVLNVVMPDRLYTPLERGGRTYGDEEQPSTRIRVMRQPPIVDETQPGLPAAPGKKRIAGPKK